MPLTIPTDLLASSEGSVSGPKHVAKIDVETLARYFHQPGSCQQAAGPSEAIAAAPRDFLKAAMRAREALQPFQVVATLSLTAWQHSMWIASETRHHTVMS